MQSAIWTKIQGLKEGETIPLFRGKHPIVVNGINDKEIFYTPTSTGKKRSSVRSTFEKLVSRGKLIDVTSPSGLDESCLDAGDRFNQSYVYAIMRHLGYIR